MHRPARGRFVVFEGGEGVGKSTQARLLARSLDALLTFEPGDTELGVQLRRLLLGDDTPGPHARTEALLVAADRAEHVERVVRPALDAGRHVVCDRFTGSTLAYQGYGRGLDLGDLAWLSAWAAGGVEPDLVVLLDLDRAEALARTRMLLGDRLEHESEAFHRRVLQGFAALAEADPQRWVRVDAAGAPVEVAGRVLDVVRDRLGAVDPGTRS